MFGLLVWARRQAGTNENAAAKARNSAMHNFMIACIVTTLAVGRKLTDWHPSCRCENQVTSPMFPAEEVTLPGGLYLATNPRFGR